MKTTQYLFNKNPSDIPFPDEHLANLVYKLGISESEYLKLYNIEKKDFEQEKRFFHLEKVKKFYQFLVDELKEELKK